MSSSIANECTFFRSLDDHATVPVLFIPDSHLSSMRNNPVVSTFSWIKSRPFHTSRLWDPRLGKTECGKVCSGKRGGYGVSESEFSLQFTNWSRNRAQGVQAAAASDSHTELGAYKEKKSPWRIRHLTHSPHHPEILPLNSCANSSVQAGQFSHDLRDWVGLQKDGQGCLQSQWIMFEIQLESFTDTLFLPSLADMLSEEQKLKLRNE